MASFPKLTSRALLSPMAGITDVAFRALARTYGAGLTYTEFVSSAAVVRRDAKTIRLLQLDPSERPCAVQVFGNNLAEVVGAAKLLEHTFDIIDVNCGCPAWKVIKTGAGSALLNNPEKIHHFIKTLTSAVHKPVTLKIRLGIDEHHLTAVEIAKRAEEAGATAIAVHGRTQKQGFSGKADWEMIKKVKKAVSIPVIGNGDIFTPQDFKKRLDESGVDYILIGRGAIGNPFLFKQINDYLEKGNYEEKNKTEQFWEYAKLANHYELPFITIKQQAMGFTKGMNRSTQIREMISGCKDSKELQQLFNNLPNHG
ncbi:tRNA dihydrouridine synthase DusB [Candidatus Woesearchaeota archaeon]|nr:tRNA dihydrouridine synthase DusB [Candidatus Woesearchaeota archaeon]